MTKEHVYALAEERYGSVQTVVPWTQSGKNTSDPFGLMDPFLLKRNLRWFGDLTVASLTEIQVIIADFDRFCVVPETIEAYVPAGSAVTIESVFIHELANCADYAFTGWLITI